jgi:hypothetical protein
MLRDSQAMTLFRRSVLLLLGCVMASCAMGRVATTEERLEAAVDLDKETAVLIDAVLDDVVNHAYRFNAYERRAALRAILRRGDHTALPAVRRVASIELTSVDTRIFADIIAVSDALTVLTELRDDTAVDLNVHWIGNASLRGFAISNLLQLKAWSATPRIQEELARMPMTNVNGSEVADILSFLSASPATDGSVCVSLERVRQAYPCARGLDPKDSFCAALCTEMVEIEIRVCADAEMRTLMDRWEQSDGEAWFIAGDRLSEFLVARPEAFLRGFTSRPESFQRWLDSLSGTTFRDFGGTFARRVALRQRMLAALRVVDRPELEASKARVLAAIENTPVTTVN